MSPIAFCQITAGVLLATAAVPQLSVPDRLLPASPRVFGVLHFFDRDFFFYGNEVILDFELSRRGIAFTKCTESAVVPAVSASAKKRTTVLRVPHGSCSQAAGSQAGQIKLGCRRASSWRDPLRSRFAPRLPAQCSQSFAGAAIRVNCRLRST